MGIFRKDLGGPDAFGESNRMADLKPGESYTIPNFKGTTVDVTITVQPYENKGRDAPIEISIQNKGAPTESPTALCGDSVRQFQIEINTDMYSYETSWALIDNTHADTVIASAPKENHAGYQQYVYPNDGTQDSYCLEDDTCYTFQIQDAYKDGFVPGDGGNYKLYLNHELLKEGGSAETFRAEELYSFCVSNDDSDSDGESGSDGESTVSPTTASPSMSPIASPPTLSPT